MMKRWIAILAAACLFFGNADGLTVRAEENPTEESGIDVEPSEIEYNSTEDENPETEVQESEPYGEAAEKPKNQWVIENGKEFFADPEGNYYKNRFISFGTIYYYMGEDGSKQKGNTKAADGKIYNLDPTTGVLSKKSGWVENGEQRYFSNESGIVYSNQFISFGNTRYYCSGDGTIIRGETDYPIAGIPYSFESDGRLIIEGGWGEYNGFRYFKNPETGLPYKGRFISFGPTKYYVNVNGLMLTGWHLLGGKQYYFYKENDKNGGPHGAMAVNKTIDGVYIDGNGVSDPAYTYAINVLSSVGRDLRAAFNWSAGMPYSSNVANPSPGSSWFAIYGFKNHTGNCYVMAATFYYMAKVLGYEAYHMSGYVPRIGGGITPHSWVEVVVNGTVYVCDPDFTCETGANGYMITYGTSGTMRYQSYYRMK